MLTCIYHPTDPFRVVEEEEANRLKATGFWFDSPAKALKYRNEVAEELNKELIMPEPKEEKSSNAKWGSKFKKEGQQNERK